MPRTRDTDSAGRILDTVEALFYGEGIHAVGMQRVIDECHCGKKLLYRDFPSKDSLVLAYLERMRQRWNLTLEAELAEYPDDPVEQLAGVVRAVGRDVGQPGYRGCAFLNAQTEFPDPDHAVHRACAAHAARLRAQLRRLAQRTDVPEPTRAADQLLLVINGLRAGGTGAGRRDVDTAVDLARRLFASPARRRGR
jgi:AcrR family transcriptional regulator